MDYAQLEQEQDPFIGVILLQRYIIVKQFNTDGAHGTLYLAKDQYSGQAVLVKITEDEEMNFKEHSILMALNGQNTSPNIYGGGNFNVEGMKQQSFIIMERLGQNLDQILDKRQKCFTLQTICQLGINLIENLKNVHSLGCVHNDIKPENIVLSQNETSAFPIRLIDFNLSTSFIEHDGSHIENKECQFSGNPIFCSKHSIIQMTPSRRDDLISLAYLLIYLHQGKLWFFQSNPEFETVEYIGMQKQISTPEMVCGSYSRVFLEFTKYVYSLGFSDEPDYFKMKQLLHECLRSQNLELSSIYDWNSEVETQEVVNHVANTQGSTVPHKKSPQIEGNQKGDVNFDQCHAFIQEKLKMLNEVVNFEGDIAMSDQAQNKELFNRVIQKHNSMYSSSQGIFEGGSKSGSQKSEVSVDQLSQYAANLLVITQDLNNLTLEKQKISKTQLEGKNKQSKMQKSQVVRCKTYKQL